MDYEMKRSADYHDYVIKNGVLVGQFEQMYRDCEDPWNQSSPSCNELSLSRQAAILLMKKHGVRSVAEWGCGLGHYSALLAKDFQVTGLDISETAIARARKRHPHISFEVSPISQISEFPADVVLFAEITWYILDQLDETFRRLRTSHSGGYLAHNLLFYKGQQRYGTEFFTTLDEFVRRCPFPVLEIMQYEDASSSTIETTSLFAIR
jgi:SAM-dependent methyltransferase